MKDQWNEAQRVLCKTYGDGDYRDLPDLYPTWLEAADSPLGDTLMRFLLIELSTEEACEDIEDAASRVERAMRDLQVVFDALAEASEMALA